MDAKVIASYFIKKANRMGDGNEDFDGNNDLTNLKLQKILYFAQAEYLKENKKTLFNDEIEAWQYGPVVKSVYDWLKGCGAYVITEMDVQLCDISKIPEDTKEFLDKVWDKYSNFSAWKLVNETHRPDSAWSKTYRNGEGDRKVISLDLIAECA